MKAKTRAGVLAVTLAAGVSIAAPAFAQEAPVEAAAVCNGPSAVQSVSYLVDGGAAGLADVTQGSEVTVNFTVAPGCDATTFGLAAYEAPAASWVEPDKQVLSASDTAVVAGGQTASLTVTVPDCYYQVDFFTGSVLSTLSDTVNYSGQGRLISFQNGGTEVCVGNSEVTTTTVPETTTTTVPETTTTTVPDSVLPEEITTTVAPTTAVVVEDEVLDETLARTGGVEGWMVAGAGLLLVGAGASGTAAARRQKRAQHFA